MLGDGQGYLVPDIQALGPRVPLEGSSPVDTGGGDTTGRGVQGTRLVGIRPNPFNATTTILFASSRSQPTRVEVFDLKGVLIRRLVEKTLEAGPHQVVWDGRDERGESVASGVYFIRLIAGDVQETRRVVLMK